ncbi:rubrerythrin [Paenibacillus wynnii]|nr:rubrerythrin [Paenibacillus wynnii]
MKVLKFLKGNDLMTKFTCPCCGYKTLDEEPPGTYDICKICFWEDDGVQFDDPDMQAGPM